MRWGWRQLEMQNVKAHAPLPAAALVDHGVSVEVTEDH
jgi:hypothetical protein